MSVNTWVMIGSASILLVLSGCKLEDSYQGNVSQPPTHDETVLAEHAPASSILKDPRLIWRDDLSQKENSPLGFGYIPDADDVQTGFDCFLGSPSATEEDLTESGIRLQTRLSKDGHSYSIVLWGVHITREHYLSELVWDSTQLKVLTSPKSEGGLGLSDEEVDENCGYGVIAHFFGQEAVLGFQAPVNANENTPPETTLFFEHSAEGIKALKEAYLPYKKWREKKVGITWTHVSQGADFGVTEEDQQKNVVSSLSNFLSRVESASKSDAGFHKGESLSDSLQLIEKAPPRK